MLLETFWQWSWWVWSVFVPGFGRAMADELHQRASAHTVAAGVLVGLGLWKALELAFWVLRRLWVLVAFLAGFGVVFLVATKV